MSTGRPVALPGGVRAAAGRERGPDRTVSTVRRTAPRVACFALLLAAPSLAMAGILAYFGYSLRGYVPGNPNDEIVNYLQVRAFATHGFRAGYFGVEEQVAPASFSRFGVHGPAFPALYGTLARPFGTPYELATYLNLAAMTLALAAYALLTRPSNVSLVLLATFFLTFWPFYLFAFSWMQDALHFAVSVLLAGLFAALWGDPPPARRRALFATTFAVLAGASLIRVSWALLLPALFVRAGGRTWRGVLAAGLAGCAAVLACTKAFQLLCAPFAALPDTFLMNKLLTGETGPAFLLQHALKNLTSLVAYFGQRQGLVRSQFTQCLLLLAAVAYVAARRGVARLRGTPEPPASAGRWLALVGYNQAAVTAATVVLYFVGQNGAPRLFPIHLLFGLLVAAAAPLRSLRAFVPVALAFNLLAAGPAARYFRDEYARRFTNRGRADKFAAHVAGLVPFDPGGDGWANTVLTDRLPLELVGLPAGIGVEYVLHAEVPEVLSRPVRSRYLIAGEERVRASGRKVRDLGALPALGGELRLPTPGPPHLYLNLDPAPAAQGEGERAPAEVPP